MFSQHRLTYFTAESKPWSWAWMLDYEYTLWISILHFNCLGCNPGSLYRKTWISWPVLITHSPKFSYPPKNPWTTSRRYLARNSTTFWSGENSVCKHAFGTNSNVFARHEFSNFSTRLEFSNVFTRHEFSNVFTRHEFSNVSQGMRFQMFSQGMNFPPSCRCTL